MASRSNSSGSSNSTITSGSSGSSDSSKKTKKQEGEVDEVMVKRDPATNRVAFVITDLDFLESIGVGLFSRVRMVRHQRLDTFFALKIMKKGEILRREQLQHVKDEISLLQRMSGSWFPTFHGVFQDDLRVYLLMELVQGGELYSHLRNVERFPEDKCLFYACQLVVIIEQLQRLDIVHRDIKPENLLFSKGGNLVLVDFGFAKVVPERTWTMCGTPEYVAPEVLEGKGYGKSVDWWALGVLVYEMLTGVPPFCDQHPFGIYKKIEECKQLYPNKYFTGGAGACKEFVGSLLTKDRTQRLGAKKGAADVMAHRWFRKVDWDAVRNQQIPTPYRPMVAGPDDVSNFNTYPDSQLDMSHPLRTTDRRAFTEMMTQVDGEWSSMQRT